MIQFKNPRKHTQKKIYIVSTNMADTTMQVPMPDMSSFIQYDNWFYVRKDCDFVSSDGVNNVCYCSDEQRFIKTTVPSVQPFLCKNDYCKKYLTHCDLSHLTCASVAHTNRVDADTDKKIWFYKGHLM